MKWSELTVEQRKSLIVERTKHMDTGPFLHCFDIAGAGLWHTGGCCESCHVDDEEYGYDLCSISLPDGREIACCCGLMVWINDAALPDWYKMTPQWVRELENT